MARGVGRRSPRRGRRLVRLAALLAGGAVALAILARVVLLPEAAGWAIRSALARSGFPRATFSLREVSLRQLRVDDVVLDRDGRGVRRVRVSYSLQSLLRGRVHHIELSGARWSVRAAGGLESWLSGLPEGWPDGWPEEWVDLGLPERGGGGLEVPARAPFDRLVVEGASVEVETARGTTTVRVDGAAFAGASGALAFHAAGRSPIAKIAIAGARARDETSVVATLEVPGPASAAVGATHRAGERGVASRVDLAGHVEVARASDLFGASWGAEDITVTGAARLTGDRLAGGRARAAASRVRVGDVALGGVTVGIRPGDTGAEVTAAVAGDRWRASMRGAIPPVTGRRSTAPIALSLTASGDLPPAVRRAAAARGVAFAPGASAELTASGRVVAPTGEASDSWELDVDRIRLDARAGALDLPGGAAVSDPDVEVTAAAGGGDVEAGAIEARGDGWRARMPALSVRVTGSRARAGGVRARGLSLRARLSSGGDRASLRGALRASVEALRHPKSGARASGVRARVPVALDLGGTLAGSRPLVRADGPGSVSAEAIGWRRLELGPLTARATERGGALSVQGTVPVSSTGAAAISARIDPRAGSGSVSLAAPSARLKPSDPLARFIAEAAHIRVSGAFGAFVDLAWQDGKLRRQTGELQLRGARITSQDRDHGAHEVRGTVRFASLSPVRTRGIQRLTWDRSRVDDRALGGGLVDVGVDGWSVRVGRAEIGTRPGRIVASGFEVDPRRIDATIGVAIRGVSLERWLEELTAGRAAGEGLIDGRFSIRITQHPSWELRLKHGELEARGPGRLRVVDERAIDRLVARYARLGRSAGEYPALVRQRLVASLADFAYAHLGLFVTTRSGDSRLRIEVRGRGRRVPQELDLTVNVNGFAEVVTPAIGLWLEGA